MELSIDIPNAATSDIIKFLFSKFNSVGASYNTLNTARSAISRISINDINLDGLLSSFLRIVYKQRPSIAKYQTTSNVTPVLNYLK